MKICQKVLEYFQKKFIIIYSKMRFWSEDDCLFIVLIKQDQVTGKKALWSLNGGHKRAIKFTERANIFTNSSEAI